MKSRSDSARDAFNSWRRSADATERSDEPGFGKSRVRSICKPSSGCSKMTAKVLMRHRREAMPPFRTLTFIPNEPSTNIRTEKESVRQTSNRRWRSYPGACIGATRQIPLTNAYFSAGKRHGSTGWSICYAQVWFERSLECSAGWRRHGFCCICLPASLRAVAHSEFRAGFAPHHVRRGRDDPGC